MDIGKSFSFAFEDKQWLSKLGLGAVIAMVPILNFAWSGYMVEIIRNVMKNVQEPLPNWDDIGKKFSEGLDPDAGGSGLFPAHVDRYLPAFKHHGDSCPSCWQWRYAGCSAGNRRGWNYSLPVSALRIFCIRFISFCYLSRHSRHLRPRRDFCILLQIP